MAVFLSFLVKFFLKKMFSDKGHNIFLTLDIPYVVNLHGHLPTLLHGEGDGAAGHDKSFPKDGNIIGYCIYHVLSNGYAEGKYGGHEVVTEEVDDVPSGVSCLLLYILLSHALFILVLQFSLPQSGTMPEEYEYYIRAVHTIQQSTV